MFACQTITPPGNQSNCSNAERSWWEDLLYQRVSLQQSEAALKQIQILSQFININKFSATMAQDLLRVTEGTGTSPTYGDPINNTQNKSISWRPHPTSRRCFRGGGVHVYLCEKTEGSYPNRTDFYPSWKCLNKADISGLNCLYLYYIISSVRYPYSRLALCGIVCSITLFKIKFNILKESLDLQLNENLWKVSKLKKVQ